MKTITKTINVYEFEELSEEKQDKLINETINFIFETIKNDLLKLIINFKAKLYDHRNEIDDKTNALSIAGKFSEASAHSYILETIDRNITSIEKQLKKL